MTTESASLKRVKCSIKTSQNPLFEKWLKEWREEATQNGSEMRHCFSKALKSLQKFPVKLYTGKECIILENFGAKLCKMLDEKLEAYKALHPEDEHLYSKKVTEKMENNVHHLDDHPNIQEKKQDTRKRKISENLPLNNKKIFKRTESSLSCNKSSKYVPAYRSGAYAILLVLYEKMQEENFKGYMTKSEIQTFAKDFCDSSFTKPLPGSHYTAWSSMGVLIRKKLIVREGNPAKFSLTKEGIDVGIKLKEGVCDRAEKFWPLSPEKDNQSKISERKSEKSPSSTNSIKVAISGVDQAYRFLLSQEMELEQVSGSNETFIMSSGTFQIKLLADTQERDEKSQHGSNMTVRMLSNKHVDFEMRHLKVGDFVWVARDASGRELVLPYVVERKRMDDLASSIKDGRFHEQKFRLKQSGLENLIYLVEKYGNEHQRLGLPLPTLLQAISNTQISGGFTIKVTRNHDHSMSYLNVLTTRLSQLFKRKSLMSCRKSNLVRANLSDDLVPLLTFEEFNRGSEKNKKPTVRNMLVRHLLQLNGVSVEKAKTVVQLYPTPKGLTEALKRGSGEKSIAELTHGTFNRALGPTTARQIRLLYTSLDLR